MNKNIYSKKKASKQHVATDQQYTCKRPSLPGTVGTPAFFIVSLAVDLSPITRMLSGCRRHQEFHSFLQRTYNRQWKLQIGLPHELHQLGNLKLLTLGPIKLIPCSLHISTNTAFSARKPYPGCSIVHPRLMAAERTFGITKYLLKHIHTQKTNNVKTNNKSLGKEQYL